MPSDHSQSVFLILTKLLKYFVLLENVRLNFFSHFDYYRSFKLTKKSYKYTTCRLIFEFSAEIII